MSRDGMIHLEAYVSSEREALAKQSYVPSVVSGAAAVIVALADRDVEARRILERWKDRAQMNSIKHDDIDAYLEKANTDTYLPGPPFHGSGRDGEEAVQGESTMSEFKPGDVVSLKSGGPKMTVRNDIPIVKPLFSAVVDSTALTAPMLDHPVTCDWFDGGLRCEGTFAAEGLEPA